MAVFEETKQNQRRSILMIAGFFIFTLLFLVAIGYTVVGGIGSVGIAILITLVTTWGAYWKSDTIALKMSRAIPADEREYARYHNLVEGLCIASGLPKPRLYIIEDESPNAFATGRNPENSAIAVTTGLFKKMNRLELEGVLAHELSHIKNYDILVNTMAVTMVGLIALVADLSFRFMWMSGHRRSGRHEGPDLGAVFAILGIILLVVAPLIAKIMQFAIGRKRETLADFSAVEITRYPPGLISALEKLQNDQTVVRSGSRATAHMWIEEPMAQVERDGNLSRLNRLFSTHPPIEQRIEALREL